MQDIKLEETQGIGYDISIENGDFVSVDGFDTSILMSILLDVRADSSEINEPEFRRGWIGNEQNYDSSYEIGSKLWLLDQSRVNQDTINRAVDFSRNSVLWMIEDNQVKDIKVTGESPGVNVIQINIEFVRFDNSVFNQQFNLWENTNLV